MISNYKSSDSVEEPLVFLCSSGAPICMWWGHHIPIYIYIYVWQVGNAGNSPCNLSPRAYLPSHTQASGMNLNSNVLLTKKVYGKYALGHNCH